MKRCWFGLLLLLVLLLAGALVTHGMTGRHEIISGDLELASAAALTGNWRGAVTALGRAQEAWEKNRHFSAAFADHEPMEEIDGMFAQARVYLLCRDREALGAVCAQLARMTRAVGEAHGLTWWNFL